MTVIVNWMPREAKLDGIHGNAVCHSFADEDATHSFCGVPREEQQTHGWWQADADRCDGCGLPHCRPCISIARRRG